MHHIRDAYYGANPEGFERDDVQDQLESYLSGDALDEWDNAADFNGADPTPE